MEHVELKRVGHVAEIVLGRPEKLNAITPEMASAIHRIAEEIDRSEEVHAVLLLAMGERAFSAGSDLESLAAYSSAWSFRNRIEYAAAIRRIRQPVVAALKGWTLGGGAEIALAADVRIADTTAKLGFPEVTRGWVGGGGASQFLPRLIGYGQALRLLLTGHTIDAAEALRLGIVEEVVEAGAAELRARALCEKIAALSPIAVQSVKAA